MEGSRIFWLTRRYAGVPASGSASLLKVLAAALGVVCVWADTPDAHARVSANPSPGVALAGSASSASRAAGAPVSVHSSAFGHPDGNALAVGASSAGDAGAPNGSSHAHVSAASNDPAAGSSAHTHPSSHPDGSGATSPGSAPGAPPGLSHPNGSGGAGAPHGTGGAPRVSNSSASGKADRNAPSIGSSWAPGAGATPEQPRADPPAAAQIPSVPAENTTAAPSGPAPSTIPQASPSAASVGATTVGGRRGSAPPLATPPVSGEDAVTGKGSGPPSSSPAHTVISAAPKAPSASPAATVTDSRAPAAAVNVSDTALTSSGSAHASVSRTSAAVTLAAPTRVGSQLLSTFRLARARSRVPAGPRTVDPQSLTKRRLGSVRAAVAGAAFAGTLTTEAQRGTGRCSVWAAPAVDGDAGPDWCRLSGRPLVPRDKHGSRPSATHPAPLPDINLSASTRKALLVGTGSGTSVPALALFALVAAISPGLSWRMRAHIGFSFTTRVDPVPAHPG
jgi:hypothetical protein